MGAHIKKAPKLCCTCKTAPIYLYGRCTRCFRAMDKSLYRKLKGMTRAERQADIQKSTTRGEQKKWEWLGDEEALAEMTAKLEAQNK